MLRFTEFILCTTLALSLVSIPLREYSNHLVETSDYTANLTNSGDAQQREARYLRRVGQAVNPNGATPVVLVLSAGFLALLTVGRRILSKLTDLAALTEAGL